MKPAPGVNKIKCNNAAYLYDRMNANERNANMNKLNYKYVLLSIVSSDWYHVNVPSYFIEARLTICCIQAATVYKMNYYGLFNETSG